MEIKEIQEIIPHRYPFLLVDKVTEINPEINIVAVKNITINEPYFQGHFPEEPVMPGVLVIEALAQTGAVLILSKEEFKGKTAYLASVDKGRFYKKIVPGDTMVLYVSIISKRRNMVKLIGEVKVNNELYVTAEIVCAIN